MTLEVGMITFGGITFEGKLTLEIVGDYIRLMQDDTLLGCARTQAKE